MALIEKLNESIIVGDGQTAVNTAKEIINNNIDIKDAILNGLSAGMKIVSEKYEKHKYFLTEIIIAADALNSAFELFKPHLSKQGKYKAKVVIGVVKGDIHEIGKNIVAQFLKAAGYYIIDLGRNAPPEKFIEAVKNNNAEFLAMSTLMSPTLEQMKIVIEKLKKEGIRDKIKVIIGGAPTDEKLAKDIGADYCCKDANEVVSLLDSILDKFKS